ncbi:MAG: putative RND superfamily exporter protein [Marivirga sp.]|jgi:predicted RND superfamily exporter protein
MNIKKKAKDEIEYRIEAIEHFIEDKGVGSTYLTRAKKVQRNMNIALVLGGAITVIGLAVWMFSSSKEED